MIEFIERVLVPRKETTVTFWDRPRRQIFLYQANDAMRELFLVVLAFAWDFLFN
jgi:hypothetical protein